MAGMRLRNELIDQGLPGKLGISNYALLTVLAAKADDEGVCRAKRIELAGILGMTPASLSRRLSELFKFEIDGKPIVGRVPGGVRLLPEVAGRLQNCNQSGTSKNINNINKLQKGKEVRAKDVLLYFGKKYREAYGCEYSYALARDSNLVRKKLLQVYGAENTLKIIDEAFRQRSLFENPPRYPYITIGGLVTFIANKVATDIIQREKRDSLDVAASNKEMMEKYWDEYFGS